MTPHETLEAYVRLRASGGLLLSVHRLHGTSTAGVGPMPFDARVLLVILDRYGWEDVTLDPDDTREGGSLGMPGASLGFQLIRYGFMRAPWSLGAPGAIFGWRRVAGTTPGPARVASELRTGPVWWLPVIRTGDVPGPCHCDDAATCERCAPAKREQVERLAGPYTSSGGV